MTLKVGAPKTMAQKDRMKDLLAGLFLVSGIALFFLSLIILGREKNLFGSSVTFRAYYADIRGLNEGAPIRLGGIPVGRVSAVELAPESTNSRALVTLSIQDTYADRIRSNSLAVIETQGLLGDKFISISNDTPANGSASESSVLHSGDVIATREAIDLNNIIRKVEILADSADDGIQSVTKVSNAFDPKKISATVDSLHKIAAALGDSRVIADLSDVVREIKNGNGLLHNLIFPTKDGDKLSQSFASFAAVAGNLERLTNALSKGSGTLGALLLDSKVYDNLVEITDDAKRSVMLRSVVRSALNEKKSDQQ